MSKEDSGGGCSCTFIIICVVLIGFFLGPSKCSCARDVVDKANEWRSFSDSVIRAPRPRIATTGLNLKTREDSIHFYEDGL